MFDLQLTPEQIEFRDAVRTFTAERIHPEAIRPARLEPFDKPLMTDLLSEASALGLRTLAVPEAAGGAGADALTSCIVLEELGAGDVDIATALGETALIAGLLLDGTLDETQRERWLAGFTDDPEFHLAFALPHGAAEDGWSYPDEGAGADVPSARADGKYWVIDGAFAFIANATIAGLFVVETDAGAFLVPRDAPGLEIGAPIGAIGQRTGDGDPAIRWHHGAGAALTLRQCKVGAGQRIAPDRANRPQLGRAYAAARAIRAAAINIGLGRAAHEAAVDYTGIRRQGGRMLIGHEAIGIKIADMAMKLEIARTMVWKAAWAEDHPDAGIAGDADLPLSVIARAYAGEAMHEVTIKAAECFGAMGVMRDMPLQKYVHDGLVFLHGADNDIASRLQIAAAVAAHRRG